MSWNHLTLGKGYITKAAPQCLNIISRKGASVYPPMNYSHVLLLFMACMENRWLDLHMLYWTCTISMNLLVSFLNSAWEHQILACVVTTYKCILLEIQVCFLSVLYRGTRKKCSRLAFGSRRNLNCYLYYVHWSPFISRFTVMLLVSIRWTLGACLPISSDLTIFLIRGRYHLHTSDFH